MNWIKKWFETDISIKTFIIWWSVLCILTFIGFVVALICRLTSM